MRRSLDAALKSFRAFKGKHSKPLGEIRHFSSAHRDHDAVALMDIIERIDLFELLGLGIQFGAQLNEVGNRAQAIMTHTAGIRPPEMEKGDSLTSAST